MPDELLKNNIDEVAKKHNLPNDKKITKILISQRVATTKHHVPCVQGNGFPYPFMKIEDEVFNLIIKMSKCYHTIRVSKSLKLINDLIENTEYQVRLNQFRHQRFGFTE